MPVNPKNNSLGLIFGAIAFLGLGFCSPPAPANEAINSKNFNDQIVCMADNIYWEARNQPVKGMWAVALVTDNRVGDDRFPNSHCEVIKQGPTSKWWFEKHGKIVPIRHRCQFSWYCDGKSDVIPHYDKDVYDVATDIATKIFYGPYLLLGDFTDGATFYHADYVYPAWAKVKIKTIKVGRDIFYKWQDRK